MDIITFFACIPDCIYVCGVNPFENVEYQPLSIPESDQAFLDTRAMDTAAIAQIYRVPSEMLQAYDRATFSQAHKIDWSPPNVKCRYFDRLPRKIKKEIKKKAIFYGRNIYILIEQSNPPKYQCTSRPEY